VGDAGLRCEEQLLRAAAYKTVFLASRSKYCMNAPGDYFQERCPVQSVSAWMSKYQNPET
jgi:hypothetical protein